MHKKIVLLLFFSISFKTFAHCPTSFKPENACFYLDQNIIYVYDHKFEHNGPYKDLKESSLESIRTDGKVIKFSRIARGVFKIDSAITLKTVDIDILNAKKKIALKLNID